MKTRDIISIGLFFSLFMFVLYLSGQLLLPFATPIMAAAVLTILCHPLHKKLKVWLHIKNRELHALLSTIAVLIIFLVPIGLLMGAIVIEVSHVLPIVHEETEKVSDYMKVAPSDEEPIPGFNHLPSKLQDRFRDKTVQIHDRIVTTTKALTAAALVKFRDVLKRTLGAISHFSILLFCLFFFFRDGPSLVDTFYRLFPMPVGAQEMINKSIVSSITGVARSTILTSLSQGAAITVGMLIIRTKGALLLGVLAVVSSVIPVVGNMIVWIPVALVFIAKGMLWKGIFLIAWGIIVLGSLEQILRPLLMGDGAELPMFWLALSLFGGLEVFGAEGMLLGPLIFGMMAVLFQIYEVNFLGGKPSIPKKL